jgi:phosphatidylinositol alpha-mannosyltransferase
VRVALVCPYSWSVPGGVQSHVSGLAAALAAGGVDVEILAPAVEPADGVLALGRSVPIPSNGSIQRVALSPAAVARTAHAVRRRGYDVVHLHEPMLPAVCLTAIAAARVPLVGTFHMFREELLWYRVFRRVVRAAAARLAARIAVSPASREYAARTVPGPWDVIPNGIDYDALARLRGERTGRRILFVGRAEPRKGLPVLVEAFRRLGHDAELVLVGPRGDFGVRVRALGRVDGVELRRQLASSDVLCAPSLGGESFGVVLAEGMAAGLPVVASRIPGYEAVLPDSCGRLVAPGDAGALAAALDELLGDADERRQLGEAGRSEAARYAWPRVAEQVFAVYERVARSGR